VLNGLCANSDGKPDLQLSVNLWLVSGCRMFFLYVDLKKTKAYRDDKCVHIMTASQFFYVRFIREKYL
jgi:hypothetical protein